MAQANVPFDKRLKQIERHHDMMAKSGAVKYIMSDGLIVARPRGYKPQFPLKGLVMLLLTGFAFKGFLFAYLGAGTYSSRVDLLQQGSLAEQAGAWVMQADPATIFIAQTVMSFLR